MRVTEKFALVLVTAPDMKTGRRLASAALKERLVACANLVPRIDSHYWWQGKVEKSPEVLILFKTTSALVAKLEKMILAQHPYDTPEFLVINLNRGNRRYLDWLKGAVKN